jgi:HAE1 family hydrophobic/amphiphilic exporter-1
MDEARGQGFSAAFIRRPIATTLIMVAILGAGLAGLWNLPVAPLPQIDFPTIRVSASLPGASPETMASSVAQPLERQFAQIPGVTQLTSSSILGNTTVVVQFELDRNIDAAANDIQSAINAASGQLPRNLPEAPTYRKVNPADAPILIMSVLSETMPLTAVSDAADNLLAQQISQLPGIGLVSIGGQQKPAIRVQIDPAKLVAKKLSLEDVRAQMAVTTVNSPKGNLNGETRNYTIYANDQLTDSKDWNDVILAYRDGAPIRVRDIGRAVTASEDNTQAAWASGTPGVFLVIFKQTDANVIEAVDRIKEELPRLKATFPPGLKVDVMSDRTQTIRASIADVKQTMAEAIVLVVAVIFAFLRSVRVTIIPSVTIPLSLVGACAIMYLLGYSIDNLSLMALIISVGFVVDDAIVMLENIFRYIEKGDRPLDAAIKGAREISFTILSISVSLIAVFIPLLLMGGIIGRLFREFAVTVSVTVALSAFVALTLTPMMAAKFLKGRDETTHGRLFNFTEDLFKRLLAAYERALDVALRFRAITILIFLASMALTGYLFVVMPKGFFPQQDTGLIVGSSEAAEDASTEQMKRKQVELGAIVGADPAVAAYAMAIGGRSSLNTGRYYITLKPKSERDVSASQVIARLRPKLEAVEGARLFMQPAQDIRVGGRSSRTLYQYTLQDGDLDELNAWSAKILDKLKTLPVLRDVTTDQQVGGTTLTLDINRDQAARYGLSPQAIDDTLYDAVGQRQVAQYFTQRNSYRVILEVLPELQGDVSLLDKLYVKSPLSGELVPLGAFATWSTMETRPVSVNHQGQFPSVTLSFNLAEGTALGTATLAVEKAVAELNPPQSLQASFQGNAQAFQDSLVTIPVLIAASLVAVYIILGILYESFVHPITILSTLPSAGLGAIVTLMLFGFDFSLVAMIGVILLIGIVKKNGIMLVDFAIHAERNDGLAPLEAIRKASLLRFRPIMMTTLAAMLGGVPLMFGGGTGAEIRQPLGFAMVGGLLVSQVMTLFTTPVV